MTSILPRTGLRTEFEEGDLSSLSEFQFVHNWIESQGIGALMAIGAGVKSGFLVTDDGGLNIAIAPGLGIAEDTVLGAVALYKSTPTAMTLSNNSTLYVFATIEDATNQSQTSGLPLFVADEDDTMPGAILLAKVTTSGGDITGVVDMREMLGAMDPLDFFAHDDSTSSGLEFGYQGGRVRQADGSVVIVAADTVELADDNTNYVFIDEDGVVDSNTTGWEPETKAIAEVTTADGEITAVQDRRVGFDFGGSGGAGTFTEFLEGDGIEIADPEGPDPTIGIADDGVTDAKVGDRTIDDSVTPASDTGSLTELLSGLGAQVQNITAQTNWFDAPPATLQEVADHIADAAPHDDHLKADGTVAWGADQNAAGNTLANLATPLAATDAVTKAYADALLTATVPPLFEVKAATTANIALTGEQTIDAVACVAGDRVLVKNQVTTSDNGVYIVSAGAWSRSTDADTAAELPVGVSTTAINGASNGGKKFVLISTITTLGTDPQVWTQDSSGVGAGEANTISNVGTEGVSLVDGKSGVDLQVRGVASMNSLLTVAYNAGTKAIRFTVNASNFLLQDLGGLLTGAKGGTGKSTNTEHSVIIGGTSNNLAEVAPNTTTTRKFLRQSGNGSAATAPVMDTLQNNDLPVFIASGGSHAKGAVPDPGATAGTSRFLCEDATFKIPPGSGGYKASSTTLETIPAVVGTVVDFNIGTGYAFEVGDYVFAARVADPTTYAAGPVTAYTAGNLSFSAQEFAGSGAHNDWRVGITGRAGTPTSDLELNAIANLTSAADRVPYFTGLGTAALAVFTSFGRSIVAAADASAVKTLLSLVKGDVGLGNVANIDTTNAANISTGTLDAGRLPNTTVTPGSYTAADITVDAAGRVTAASNGSGGGGGSSTGGDLYLHATYI